MTKALESLVKIVKDLTLKKTFPTSPICLKMLCLLDIIINIIAQFFLQRYQHIVRRRKISKVFPILLISSFARIFRKSKKTDKKSPIKVQRAKTFIVKSGKNKINSIRFVLTELLQEKELSNFTENKLLQMNFFIS